MGGVPGRYSVVGKAVLTGALVASALFAGAAAAAQPQQTSALPRPQSSVLIALSSSRGKPAAEQAMRSLPAGTPVSVSVLRSAVCSGNSLAAAAHSTVILVAAGGYSCAPPPPCDPV